MSENSLSAVPLLDVQNVTKSFPGVRALQEVSFALQAGEVLAVIGENGAGKSTMMKILAGVQEPDSGQVFIDAKPVRIDSTRAAMELGVVLIHQELNLADNLDVGSNIFLGREPRRGGLIDRRRIYQESKVFLQRVGLEVAPETIVDTLPIGKQQLVEIAKALSVSARVLIMDEPTSSLSSKETEALFDVVKDLRSRGVSVIYISHRLGEVRELADRVTVLRDGQNAGDLSRDEITHDQMVNLMVGRDVSQFYAREHHEIGDVRLEVQDLITPAWPQHKLNFKISAGEIVGVAGLVGAGRTEMLQVLFGIDKRVGGRILVDGKAVAVSRPADAIEAGMALVPEDRKQHGLVLEMSVLHNMGLAGLSRNSLAGGFLNRQKEKSDSTQMIEKMRVRTPSDGQVVQYLSGGNQQKVVIGKWLSVGPRILLLDEPTRGIDVGAKEEIYRLMEQLAAEGMAVFFVSSEMEEILGMSDRVLVMHEGQISGELLRDQLSEESVMQLATGNPLAAC
ncbi:sugar ABC transporter ATP-binding protein [Planctomycetes bacterium K23_9]|uniref:Ribose import ATP-binding protein RbsA n=1 Tax=Stieleria marina TaxID=1930275 RepID=A0A517NQG1_9BACT|nr:Ribose import ATP-binding protein RbsA [Planctomycetes bacterium K23_9]